MMPPVLELRNITKEFPGVLANDHIDLTLNKGEILALLGENGAGKTTLMNILYGLYTPDAGEIFIRKQKVEIHNPNDAIEQGIGMVHQHFMLIPVFTVTENVMLGVESMRTLIPRTRFKVVVAALLAFLSLVLLPGWLSVLIYLGIAGVIAFRFLDRKKAADRIREISTSFGLDVDPDSYVEDLAVGVQQRVEIIKILYRQAEILILDEPTAVLTPQEADELFKVIRSLVDKGKSIIFITHKLKEVLAIADRIAVLRNGKVVGTTTPEEATEASLAKMMVGREVILHVEKKKPELGEVALSVEDLVVMDDRGIEAVEGISLQVQQGEVLGIAGVQGNGQTQLVEALTGLRKVESGRISILGQDMSNASPRKIREAGSAHVPEDRQADGLVLSFPVVDNLVLNTYYEPPFAKGITLQADVIEKAGAERVELFDIRTPSIFIPTSSLSGGNQQKVIVAREFSRPIKLLIASQPTRGLDVGSIEYIHSRIIQKRDEGCAVLLVSPELDEIMSLSDRIAVMFEGKIIAVLPAAEARREKLGLLMAGIQPEEPSPVAA